jgi:hypothetical protein
MLQLQHLILRASKETYQNIRTLLKHILHILKITRIVLHHITYCLQHIVHFVIFCVVHFYFHFKHLHNKIIFHSQKINH